MTREQAQQIKRWRDDLDAGWRRIATLWVDTYGEDELAGEFSSGWTGNQLAGMLLHERAMAEIGTFD